MTPLLSLHDVVHRFSTLLFILLRSWGSKERQKKNWTKVKSLSLASPLTSDGKKAFGRTAKECIDKSTFAFFIMISFFFVLFVFILTAHKFGRWTYLFYIKIMILFQFVVSFLFLAGCCLCVECQKHFLSFSLSPALSQFLLREPDAVGKNEESNDEIRR